MRQMRRPVAARRRSSPASARANSSGRHRPTMRPAPVRPRRRLAAARTSKHRSQLRDQLRQPAARERLELSDTRPPLPCSAHAPSRRAPRRTVATSTRDDGPLVRQSPVGPQVLPLTCAYTCVKNSLLARHERFPAASTCAAGCRRPAASTRPTPDSGSSPMRSDCRELGRDVGPPLQSIAAPAAPARCRRQPRRRPAGMPPSPARRGVAGPAAAPASGKPPAPACARRRSTRRPSPAPPQTAALGSGARWHSFAGFNGFAKDSGAALPNFYSRMRAARASAVAHRASRSRAATA